MHVDRYGVLFVRAALLDEPRTRRRTCRSDFPLLDNQERARHPPAQIRWLRARKRERLTVVTAAVIGWFTSWVIAGRLNWPIV